MKRRTLAPLLILVLALAGSAPASAGSASADSWTAPSAITAVAFSPDVLESLGIQIDSVHPSAESPGFPGSAFRTRPGSMLEFAAPGGDFERFDGGVLLHEGGFVLRLPNAELLPLEHFALQVAAPPDDFDWMDTAGRRHFVLRHMQFTTSLADQELQLLNVSIHLAPELAEFLGRPDLADSYVGVANIRLPALIPPELARRTEGGKGAGDECVEVEGPIDVALTELGSPSQVAREPGVRVALAPSATLSNVGTGSVDWYESIEPKRFDGIGAHPFLSLSMYRLDTDEDETESLVQLGLADVKHAFRALNLGCSCPSAPILYPGCGDVYGVSTNENRQYLAPRQEVAAFTGTWERVGSHFDQCLGNAPLPCDPATDDDDDFRDHYGEGSAYHDSFEHRLVVPESELSVDDARYFVEAWYLVAGDVNLSNSLGHREVIPEFSGSSWSFDLESDLQNGSVLEELSAAVLEDVDSGEGRLQLGVATTDLGGGVHHYEYTLMNFDFDRQIERISMPLEPGIVVSNARSRGLGDDPAGDWTASFDDTAIAWQAPVGGALDWGMLVSVGFDADVAPVPGEVSLGVLEPGVPVALRVSVPTPVPEPVAGLLGCVALAGLAALRAGREPRR